MYYCTRCGFYSKDPGQCDRCEVPMTHVTGGHRAKCINGSCGNEWEIEIDTFNGCPKCKAPRVMLIGPTEEPVLNWHHRLTYAFIAVDVLVVYWSQNIRRSDDPTTAGTILESLSKLKVATLGDLWNMEEKDRNNLPKEIFDEQFQFKAIVDFLVARNGVFLDDEPMANPESVTLEQPPVFGYEVSKCLTKDEKGRFQDVDLPKPEGWNNEFDKAWQNFLQEELCIKDYGDIKQITSPPEAAWPVPPTMKLDEGSKELLNQALNMDTAYIGAANIYTGIVYVFPLVPHPCYFSDYSEGDDIPDGYYRAKKPDFMPFVYRPGTRIVSKSQALMSPDKVGGSSTAGIKADCPNFQKVWVWDTGELLHGIFHKAAPPVIYRLVAPKHKDTTLSAHIKLVQSVLVGTENDYVGFTFYLRNGLSGVRRKYLRPNSTGCNAHKFKSPILIKGKWQYDNTYVNMPPDWLKALFGCFFSQGFFSYFGDGKYEKAKEVGRKEYDQRIKALEVEFSPIPQAPPPNLPVISWRDKPKSDTKDKVEEKPPIPVAPTTDQCTVCGSWLSWRWPQRCLKCHPIDYKSFPKWNPDTNEFVWGGSASDKGLVAFHMGTKSYEPPSEYAKYGCDRGLMDKFLRNPQRFLKKDEIKKENTGAAPQRKLGNYVSEMVSRLEKKDIAVAV